MIKIPTIQYPGRNLLLLLMICVILFPIHAQAADLDIIRTRKKLDAMVGTDDAILLRDMDGKNIYANNQGKKLVPASTLKLLTSLAAIKYLGRDFRFVTKFFMDCDNNLKIKGYGDPLLISEVIAKIAVKLSSRVHNVNNLILDDTYFQNQVMVPGAEKNSIQPYDAPNGALCANFNTVKFIKSSDNGQYRSAESQTPLLPFIMTRIKASSLNKGRIVLSSNGNETTIYAGLLFQYFLKKSGVGINGKIMRGRVDLKKDRLVFQYESEFSLEDIIRRMLLFSNNFIANQLFITSGVKIFRPPGTLDKGVKAVLRYSRNKLGLNDITLVEGSGISRKNRLSAEMMDRVLEEFKTFYRLMRHKPGEYYKTGTLKGIHTRVGYISKDSGEMYRFVIFFNTPGKSPSSAMDLILKLTDFLQPGQ